MTAAPGERFSPRRLQALCVKETRQILRDPSSLLIAVVLPVALLFIFGYGISLDTNRVRMGVALEDQGVEAARIADAVRGSAFLDPTFAPTLAALRPALTRGTLRGVLVVPQDFSAKVARGDGTARLLILTDGSEPNTATFVANYAAGVMRIWLAQKALAAGAPPPPGVELEPRYWFNPTTVSRNFLIPGSISVVMTIIGALLTSLVVAREWERGTMEALLATPVRRSELLLSKILPYYLLALVAMAICVAIAVFLMGVPFRGSLPMLFLSTSLFLGSALGLGLLLSTVTRPVQRRPGGAQRRLPARRPALGADLRDRLDAGGDPGGHPAGAGAVFREDPPDPVPGGGRGGDPAAEPRLLSAVRDVLAGAHHAQDPPAAGRLRCWGRSSP